MLQMVNNGPFAAVPAVFPNPQGVDSIYVYIKGTFDLQGRILPKDQQVFPSVSDQYYGDPLETSVKASSDLTLGKPGTDVLLSGHAYAPKPGTMSMDVSLTVGPIKKTVCVFGDRVWVDSLLGWKPSPPKSFEKIPLRYEYAFGGTDKAPKDESKIEMEPRNPLGRGLLPKRTKSEWKGQPLPNIEDPRALISGPRDRPTPACFASISPHWEPRKRYAGTYDEAWQKKRAPYLPKDFDARFFHAAPVDQIVPGFLQGGEPVEVVGCSTVGPCRFTLPCYRHTVECHLGAHAESVPIQLETVMIDMDAGRLMLVWAGNLCSGQDTLRIEKITVNSIPHLTLT